MEEKDYEETFRSAFGQNTEEAAQSILEKIRKEHPTEKGWVEIDAGVEKNAEGKYIAWRKHKKVRTQEIERDDR